MSCKVLVLSVLVLYLHQGEAIKCHTCTSATDAKCGDPTDSSLPLTECTPSVLKDATALFKSAADAASTLLGKIGVDSNIAAPEPDAVFTCAKAVKQEGDKKVVVRSCSIAKNEQFDSCAVLKKSGAIVTFCETCDSDGCNAASGVAPTSLLLLLTAALAFYLVKQ